jgi:GTP-binding protein EngB required for normal cell division
MKQLEIENRLERIANIYNKLAELMERLPDEIPESVKQKITNLLLADKNMKELIDGIRKRRPPRFILIGRTGVGKSSLINAMCGKYLAKESDVKVGTTFREKYSYKFMGKTIFEVIDTRGIGESLKTNISAEEDLKNLVDNFSPDAIMFLVEGRAYVPDDIVVLKKINGMLDFKIPIIAISSQVDKLQEGREKNPKNYSERKKKNIKDTVYQFSKILEENDITPLDIIPISSYIEWSEDPTKVKKENWHKLEIAFDGRYNIDKILDLLENNINVKAGIFLMLYSRLDQVTRKMANKFTNIF